MSAFTIGQELWWVPTNGRGRSEPSSVTVTKLGRRWIGLSNGHKFDIDTMRADGGQYSSPGRCYLSQAEHEREMALEFAWAELRAAIENHYRPPPGVTVSQIDNAKRALFKGSSSTSSAGQP